MKGGAEGPLSLQDTRTSERYMPRWEIWMGVFVHHAVANVVNSLLSFSVRTESQGGQMISETIAAWDKLVGNVLILESHIMDKWRRGESDVKTSQSGLLDKEFSLAQGRFHDFIEKTLEPNHIQAMDEATKFYHAILELLNRRGLLRFKPPRSFGKKHDD
jgi:hypothetical protein